MPRLHGQSVSVWLDARTGAALTAPSMREARAAYGLGRCVVGMCVSRWPLSQARRLLAWIGFCTRTRALRLCFSLFPWRREHKSAIQPASHLSILYGLKLPSSRGALVHYACTRSLARIQVDVDNPYCGDRGRLASNAMLGKVEDLGCSWPIGSDPRR